MSAAPIPPANASVGRSTSDDGPGVPLEDRDRTFERFVRLEEARTRDEGGSGLGLALVHAVTQAHGGEVRRLDGDDGGSLFEVRLPKQWTTSCLIRVGRSPRTSSMLGEAPGGSRGATLPPSRQE